MMNPFGIGIQLAEQGLLPDQLIRIGIRILLRQRLRQEEIRAREVRNRTFLEAHSRGPVALVPEKPNRQHYEIPADFFQAVLGTRMKYSGCYWPMRVSDLDKAEEEMLALTIQRAGIEDGMKILELGCGWGALTLWIAERFPQSHVVAMSNSRTQCDFILHRVFELGLDNVSVSTSDMNHFAPSGSFDRVVSVEMFEHMNNFDELLRRISHWLNPDGYLFVHTFCHRSLTYAYETKGWENWMGRYFFTGGIMPSQNFLSCFNRSLEVIKNWYVDGSHYQKTASAWLAHLDQHYGLVRSILEEVYSQSEVRIWCQRWRIFFMACEELFGYQKGQQWGISHSLLKPRPNSSE